MTLEDYKNRLDTDCVVIDPRSRKKEWEGGTVVKVNISIFNNRNGYTTIGVSYNVKLHKITHSKTRHFNKDYHRIVVVSNDNIRF